LFYLNHLKISKNLSIKQMKNKSENAYKTIGEVVKIIGLQSKKGQSIPTHTIRYWEKEFKQIKPKILNGNRRYYDEKNIILLKKVEFFFPCVESIFLDNFIGFFSRKTVIC